MNAPELVVPADTWAPLMLRWRFVQPGDTTLGPDGSAWHVTNAGPSPRGWSVVLVRGDQVTGADVNPEAGVNVLVPLVEREAFRTLREQGLGPQMIGRVA